MVTLSKCSCSSVKFLEKVCITSRLYSFSFGLSRSTAPKSGIALTAAAGGATADGGGGRQGVEGRRRRGEGTGKSANIWSLGRMPLPLTVDAEEVTGTEGTSVGWNRSARRPKNGPQIKNEEYSYSKDLHTGPSVHLNTGLHVVCLDLHKQFYELN